jgi:hypothetical protein
MPADELAALASHSIALDPEATVLHVSSVELAAAPTVDEVDLRCAVTVRRPGRADQRWQVTLRFGDDLDPRDGASPVALVAVVRALLDEWWLTKDGDPATAAWGVREL